MQQIEDSTREVLAKPLGIGNRLKGILPGLLEAFGWERGESRKSE
jgi:hypothetical protein